VNATLAARSPRYGRLVAIVALITTIACSATGPHACDHFFVNVRDSSTGGVAPLPASTNAVQLNVGDTATLFAVGYSDYPKYGCIITGGIPATWTISDSSIAALEQFSTPPFGTSALLRGRARGQAMVTVVGTASPNAGARDSVSVTVQ